MEGPHSLPKLNFRDWKYLDAHLVWIYEGRPQNAGKFVANNTNYTAWYLIEGEVRGAMQGNAFTAKAGDWVLLPAGYSERHFSPDARILSIQFDASWITGQGLFGFKHALLLGTDEAGQWFKASRPMLRRVRRHYPDVYNQLPDAVADYEMYSKIQRDFQDWLWRVWAVLRARGVADYTPKHQDSRALDMKRWMDAQSVQQPFRLPELAAAFGLSPGQVNRIFCADFEMTPKRYFEQRRLSVAKGVLHTSSQALKELSYSIGFKHQAEFTAWFKKHTGLSPSRYREQIQTSP